ncbi:MAG: murein biosynthesis integral membrane protein MurJ [Acidimicrobiales bacterium]
MARASGSISVLTALSRVTGLVRTLVLARVVGVTFLGNTYQSANAIPNFLFEVVAAGLLSAVLLPPLVGHVERNDRDQAQRLISSVTALALGLGLVAAVAGVALAPTIMALLTSGTEDPGLRRDQIELGTFFLWVFCPQIAFYALGVVSTTILHAHRRFALVAVAPMLNNLVVIACYLVFASLGGDGTSVALSSPQKWVLAGGTTLGVVVFCVADAVGAVRLGYSLRPRWGWTPDLGRLVGGGVWSMVLLAGAQAVGICALVLTNGVEGGVIAFALAMAFFLLPHALCGLPVATAAFPHLAAARQAGDPEAFSRVLAHGLRLSAFAVIPAAAALAALAGPISQLALLGAGDGPGAAQVRGTLVALAPGLIGYSWLVLASRAAQAGGNQRAAAVAHIGLAVAAAASMVAGYHLAPAGSELVGVAGGHSVAYLMAAAGLLVHLVRSEQWTIPWTGLRDLAMMLVGAGLAAVAMAGVESVIDPITRSGITLAAAAAETVAAVTLGSALYLTLSAVGWRLGWLTRPWSPGSRSPFDRRPDGANPGA